MPETTKIEPALSQEDWVWRLSWSEKDRAEFKLERADGDCRPLRWSLHGLAALALYGQPFGFDQRDVSALRGAADFYFPNEEHENRWIHSIADRIEALLPPRDEYPLDRGDA